MSDKSPNYKNPAIRSWLGEREDLLMLSQWLIETSKILLGHVPQEIEDIWQRIESAKLYRNKDDG